MSEAENLSQGSERRSGKPHVRQTKSREEMDRRISFTACLLSQLVPMAEIKQQLMRRYECSYRMTARYVSQARNRLAEWTGIGKDEAWSEVAGILHGLLRSNLDVRDKLAVIDRIIELYGLAAAREHTVRGDKDHPSAHVVETVVTSRAEAKELLAAMRSQSVNGNGNSH